MIKPLGIGHCSVLCIRCVPTLSLPLVQAVTVKSRFLEPNFQPSDNLNKTNFLSTVKHCNFDHFPGGSKGRD